MPTLHALLVGTVSTPHESREKRKRCGNESTNQFQLKDERITKRECAASLLLLVIVCCAAVVSVGAQGRSEAEAREFPIEVVAVLEFPISLQNAKLIKTDKGYLLSCQISNASEGQMIGLRYSLVIESQSESTRLVINRSEGVKIKPYDIQRTVFPTPFKDTLKRGSRMVLMLEQAVSANSIWEVVKAKDVLSAYLSGDYSVIPTVVRTANQVDAPLPPRIIYRD